MVKKPTKCDIVIARDIQLAKILAGNNKKLRERALNRLKKWFELRSHSMPFTELDFMRIWKGLFYSLWMSDKPLVQEECAESISHLVHFNAPDTSLLFFKCGLQTLCNEWFGIDQIRLGKFLLFVRRFLRQGLTLLKNSSWNIRLIKSFNENVLTATVFSKSAPGGLTMHFIEVYLEELAKVSKGELKLHALTEMLRPFVLFLAQSSDTPQRRCIKQNIFHHLIKQSDAGFEYEEKFKAWKREGFPGDSINAMQKQHLANDDNGDDKNNTEEEVQLLDPRAGYVDVDLPQLKFSSKQIIELLTQHKFIQGSNVKSRKTIALLIDDFTKLAKGRYPLGIEKLDFLKKDGYSTRTKQAVNRLVKFEQKLLGKTRKRKKQNQGSTQSKRRKIDSELAEFIEKSEGENRISLEEQLNKPDRKKRKNDASKMNKATEYQCSFKRNSGTWFVYETDDFSKNDEHKSKINGSASDSDEILLEVDYDNSFAKNQKFSPNKKGAHISTPNNSKEVFVQEEDSSFTKTQKFSPTASKKHNSFEKKQKLSPTHSSTFNKQNENNLLQKKQRLSPNKKDIHLSTPNNNKIFAQNEWDLPLIDGEVEIFVPSQKSPAKALVKNPFSGVKKQSLGASSSSKKVKIDLKLNRSQEIHEHVAQIKNSPGIPFDANKKPTKPLLKSTGVSSPINPFYKRKLKL